MNETSTISGERAGVPRLVLYTGLFVAVAVGYTIVVNASMGLGLVAALALLCLAALRPAGLVPLLVALSVVIESTLREVSVSAGGRELLNFNGVVNCALIGTTTLYVVAGRIRPLQSSISRSFLLYCAAVAVSLLFSVDAALTVKSLIRITAAYCIYLFITQFLTERRQIDRAFQVLVIVSVVPIAVGLYQIVFVNRFAWSRDMRMAGTFATGMSFAMYLALILPYLFGQALSARTAARKWLMGALFLAGLLNLAYNPTRIAWGVFAITMLAYAAILNIRRLLPLTMVLMLVTVIAFSSSFARYFGAFLRTDWRTYFSDDTSWNVRSQDYLAASSLHIRVYVWRNMLREVMQNNALTGRGSGTWFDAQDRKLIGLPLASHSDYVEVLYGTGLLGFAAYVLFRIRQLALLARFAGSDVEIDVKRTVLYPCLLIHVGCLGMSITEVWQSYSGIYWLSWITFAISEAYYNTRLSDPPDSSLAAEAFRDDKGEPGGTLPPGSIT